MVVIFDQDFNRRFSYFRNVFFAGCLTESLISAHNDKQAMDRAYRIVSQATLTKREITCSTAY